jgi:hypothetical protein
MLLYIRAEGDNWPTRFYFQQTAHHQPDASRPIDLVVAGVSHQIPFN